MTAQLELLGSGTHSPSGAQAWSTLDQRARGASFVALPVRSVLNTPAATGMNFWSLNPYVGCEFGCAYCYARDTHRYAVERAGRTGAGLPPWLDFERRILVKTEAPAVLARTLRPARLGEHSLVIGTATDPYQPAERRFRLTRRLLETLLGFSGLSIGLITKSPLVTRDLDLLSQLAERHDVSVNISLATLDAALARRLEPRTPVPRARIRALRRLAEAGLHAGLLVAPILPCLTDGQAALSALFAAAKDAGAGYVVGMALRLGPAARRRFLPFLAQEFPDLAPRYERHYARRNNAGWSYQQALSARLAALQRKHGFPVGESTRRRRQLESARPAGSPLQTVLL
ncbi:MAG TPA: radical SAM protein [Gemmatimonadales bacterium]|nr:radical SAM protein [Gemmatimonadales bacterium]